MGIGPIPVQNYSNWIGLDLDGPGLDWSNARLVESLRAPQHPRVNTQSFANGNLWILVVQTK